MYIIIVVTALYMEFIFLLVRFTSMKRAYPEVYVDEVRNLQGDESTSNWTDVETRVSNKPIHW